MGQHGRDGDRDHGQDQPRAKHPLPMAAAGAPAEREEGVPVTTPPDDCADLEYEQDGWDEDDEDDEVECGLMPDGQCRFAGSEHCDWICQALDETDDEVGDAE